MNAIGLIPARMESTRLPGKPLAMIGGVPMIVRVYQAAIQAKSLSYVAVCTDSLEIASAIQSVGGDVIPTGSHHVNGTTRIAEAYRSIQGVEASTVIVDIQGDDPLVDPRRIDDLVDFHYSFGGNVDVTVSVGSLSLAEELNQNVVKVIPGAKHSVYAMTRSPNFPCPFRPGLVTKYKHLSTIAFSPDTLLTFERTPESDLEMVEGIELLRCLSHSSRVKYHISEPTVSVDTPEDLERVRDLIERTR